jgi:hypothetical protein
MLIEVSTMDRNPTLQATNRTKEVYPLNIGAAERSLEQLIYIRVF